MNSPGRRKFSNLLKGTHFVYIFQSWTENATYIFKTKQLENIFIASWNHE